MPITTAGLTALRFSSSVMVPATPGKSFVCAMASRIAGPVRSVARLHRVDGDVGGVVAERRERVRARRRRSSLYFFTNFWMRGSGFSCE